jgi:hypothetical protein
MDNIKSQVVEKIKGATNILVTVSSNPSVDQLTACLGMTLWLNKLGKHATAVFSGDIPNAIEFLQPEVTLEKTTDSLRDFIIALDKSKADKLRYKVEDRVVKIFITPYRTSLSSSDLEFSQGDFNVDAILALGVTKQDDLDNAIVAHGRILHDATVISMNTTDSGGIGLINWHDAASSSLCELIYDLGQVLDISKIDPQIATALLTGIVAETNRFSNNKTSPQTMSVAAALMGAGANQQLVANKLEVVAEKDKPEATVVSSTNTESYQEPKAKEYEQTKADNGALAIAHEEHYDTNNVSDEPKNEATQDNQTANGDAGESNNEGVQSNQRLITESPQLGGDLNSISRQEGLEEELNVDPLNLPSVDPEQILNREPLQPIPDEVLTPKQEEGSSKVTPYQEPLKEPTDSTDSQTLTEIEHAVASPHIADLRDEVQDALKDGQADELKPTEALNAIAVDLGNNPNPNDSVAFKPDNFELLHDYETEEPNSNDSPPQVPPPIVPPDLLPPSPPN